MNVHDVFYQGQTKAIAFVLAVPAFFGLIEAFENATHLIFRNAHALVADRNGNHTVARPQVNGNSVAIATAEFNGIVQ